MAEPTEEDFKRANKIVDEFIDIMEQIFSPENSNRILRGESICSIQDAIAPGYKLTNEIAQALAAERAEAEKKI